MLEWIIGIVGGLGTASGWFFAWRSRGEASDAKDDANRAAERARIEAGRADAAEAKAQAADSARVVAETQLKVAAVAADGYKFALDRSNADKEALYAQLAKLGAPVGADLFDSTSRRLYANRDRGAPGGAESSNSGGGPVDVPVVPGPAAAATGKS